MTNCSTVRDLGNESSLEELCQTQFMAEAGQMLQHQIHRTLEPIATQWAGEDMELFQVYGVRRYTRGAWLAAHVDKEGND